MGKCCRAEYICGLTEFIEDVIGGGGGGGTPGAPVNSIQYNSAGAFAGDSAFTYSGTALALTGTGSALTLNRSASALTTSLPALSITQTWNAVGTTFTGAVINVTDTASAAASKILDAQLGGVSRLNVNKSGLTAINGPAISGSGEILTLTTSLGTASLRVGTGNQFIIGGDIAAVGNASLISASAHLKFGTGSDAGILYTAAGALKVTDGSSGLGTITASGASITPAWSGTGTATTPLLVNVTADPGPANAASKLLDLQVAGSSKVSVRKDGMLHVGAGGIYDYGSGQLGIGGPTASSIYVTAATLQVNNIPLSFGASLGASDLFLYRDAADILAQRNATTAQKLSVYNTYTDGSNYERGVIDWKGTSNTLRIGTEQAGTGVARDIVIVNGSTEIARFFNGTGAAFTNGLITQSSGGSTKGIGIGWANVSTIGVVSGGRIGFVSSATDAQGSPDAALTRAGAAILGITNGSTGPGKLAIDNVQGANLERLKVEWDTNVARIGTEKAGSGTSRDLAFITDNQVRMVIYGAGGINTGNNVVTVPYIHQTSSRMRMETPETITNANDTGTVGQICWDSGNIYVCVATDTWKRVAIATWP